MPRSCWTGVAGRPDRRSFGRDLSWQTESAATHGALAVVVAAAVVVVLVVVPVALDSEHQKRACAFRWLSGQVATRGFWFGPSVLLHQSAQVGVVLGQ